MKPGSLRDIANLTKTVMNVETNSWKSNNSKYSEKRGRGAIVKTIKKFNIGDENHKNTTITFTQHSTKKL